MYKVEIALQRKPAYYFVVIILPTLMFSLLNPLVFLLPIESGERISLSMTILLAFVFFLTLVANFIPESSTAMCFLLVIMIIMIAISSMIVVPIPVVDDNTTSGPAPHVANLRVHICVSNGNLDTSVGQLAFKMAPGPHVITPSALTVAR
jgi:hypothetical protein